MFSGKSNRKKIEPQEKIKLKEKSNCKQNQAGGHKIWRTVWFDGQIVRAGKSSRKKNQAEREIEPQAKSSRQKKSNRKKNQAEREVEPQEKLNRRNVAQRVIIIRKIKINYLIMALEVGDKAPQFEGRDQDGKLVSLSDFAGKKLLLYFYPKDNTPGCTAQACNLRDNYESLQAQGFAILGVSSNDEQSHQKFIAKYSLPFPLLADTDKSVHELFGTWKEKSMYGKKYMGTERTTFLIDEAGIIRKIFVGRKVKTKDHAAQILAD